MCRSYGWVVVCAAILGSFLNAAENPRYGLYVKDFVRVPGLLSEFGCPDEVEVDDLIRVGLYPVGFVVENNGHEPFVVSEKTFRFPAINLRTVAPALCDRRKNGSGPTSSTELNALIIAALVAGCCQQLDFAKVRGTNVAAILGGSVGLLYYLAQWRSDFAIYRWIKHVSRLQSEGGSILVLPGRQEKFLLLLTRGIYTSSFPLYFDSFPSHEFQAVTSISFLENNVDDLRMKMYSSDMPDAIKYELRKEMIRLSELPSGSQEAPGIRAYIEWVIDLPWGKRAKEVCALDEARAILDADHYGLTDIKERILDIIAMRIRKQDASPPIICLVGPPGTGKTSLARSIAKCLGRPFERISVGGVDDEADIRGHRRTYIGAIPGRIMTAINNAHVCNPLILIDEVDKMGNGRSDAARAAILEVLDPEQNGSFRDHYLGVPFDCSQVLFIATANSVYDIPPALVDRMEIIQLTSYTLQEKKEIVDRYIWPRAVEKTGLTSFAPRLSLSSVEMIITHYTAEAGVRELDRLINILCMKVGRALLEGEEIPEITHDLIEKYLGTAGQSVDEVQKTDAVGVVNGIAYTSIGGMACPIEVALMPGKGKLILTGQLGQVMQESAKIARSYLRSHGAQWKISSNVFSTTDVHIHVSGGLPKDGPSAGITVVTALISAFTNRKVDCRVAMTGQIDLQGNVLPIGGLKEKVLAAKRHGIYRVIAPSRNKTDITDFQEQISDVEMIWVDTIDQVLERVLLK